MRKQLDPKLQRFVDIGDVVFVVVLFVLLLVFGDG